MRAGGAVCTQASTVVEYGPRGLDLIAKGVEPQAVLAHDDEAIAAVDKFRADRSLTYQGNPPGLVDARMIDALKAAYLEKKKKR